MSDQTMLRFLSAGLVNVGGDDTKLEKLRETAADLAAALKVTPTKVAPFALIAVDPDAPATDPVLTAAVDALQKRWATYINTFAGTPVAVLRAVMLDALVRAASENDNVGVAFVTSVRNALPLMEANNEGPIWADLVSSIERRLDQRAESEWATPETINVPAMTFQSPAAIEVRPTPVSIDKNDLTRKFEAAAGPNAGRQTGGNPHWPSANQPWLTEFGTRMADAVSDAILALAKGYEIKPIDLSGPLKGLAQTVSAHVDVTLQAFSGATAGLQRRTNLIWWKEALFSPSAHVSYRVMPPAIAATLMAFDLHRQVPTFSPASVAAFLHEAVLSLPSIDPAQSRPVREYLLRASTAVETAPVRQAAADLIPESSGRGQLLGLIGQGKRLEQLDDQAFRDRTGIRAGTEMTAPQWATWIFRELQGARAAQEGTEAKKGRKNK